MKKNLVYNIIILTNKSLNFIKMQIYYKMKNNKS
jgi:hypothetical protein